MSTLVKPNPEDVNASNANPDKKEESYDIDSLISDAHATYSKNKYIRCILWGPAEVGKTYCALSFPGPIWFIDLDGGLNINLKYYQDKTITKFSCLSTIADAEGSKSDSYDGFSIDPINSLRNFDGVISHLQGTTEGTIVVDTMSGYNDWLKMLFNAKIPKHIAADGKEYVDQYDWKYVNDKWNWTWQKLKNINTNLVVIAKSRAVYQKREITTFKEMDLRTGSSYQPDITIEMIKDDSKNRIGKINKFRGNNFKTKKAITDVTYDKIIKALNEEGY